MNDRTLSNPSRRRAVQVAAAGLATLGAPALLKYARAHPNASSCATTAAFTPRRTASASTSPSRRRPASK